MRSALLASFLALAGCNAQQNAAVDKAVVAGQQFCAKATAAGPLVVALVDTAGAPVTVTNKASAVVSATCALAGAIPASPPPNPGQAPVVAVAIPKP